MRPLIRTGCPYCGESIELVVDDSVDEQTYIEDCPVCCRPINVSVCIDEDGDPQVTCTDDNAY
jgi:hypothetical protein